MGSKRVAELRSLGEVDAVTSAGKPTVVMFYAPWCPHCRSTKPVLDKVAEKLVSIEFKQIDASGIAEVRGPYGVTAYPTIKYFDHINLGKEGGIKYQWHGANEDDLRGFLERTALSSGVVALEAPGLSAGAWAAELAQPSVSNAHNHKHNASGTMQLLLQALAQAKKTTSAAAAAVAAPEAKLAAQESTVVHSEVHSPLSTEALADVIRLAERSRAQQAQHVQPVQAQPIKA